MPRPVPSALEALTAFVATPVDELLGAHLRTDPERAALELFWSVARDVPAYRDFLALHGVDASRVVGPEDFRRLPFTTKEEYLRRHPLPALCRGGRLAGCDTVAVSSGSTGEPTFFPRAVSHEF